METEKQRHGSKFSAGIRVCALMLAALMIVTTIFAVLVRVTPAGAGFVSAETALSAFNSIAQDDEYLNASAMERVRLLLLSMRHRQNYTAEEYENVASIYIGREDYEEALYLYDQCIAKSAAGEDKTVLATRYLKRGSLNVLSGNLDATIEDYNTVIAKVGNATTARLLLAQVYVEKQDYASAAEQMKQYVDMVPDDEKNRAMYAAILENAGDFDAAYEQYSILSKDGGDGDMEITTSLVRTALQSGRYEETVSRLDGEITRAGDPDGARHFLRGIARLWNEEYSEAAADFLAAVELGYEDPTTCYKQLSLCAYVQADYENAIAYGKRAEELWGEAADGECLQRMGLSAMQLGDYATALDYLKRSLAAAPSLFDNNYYIATLYLVYEDYDKAYDHYSNAIEAGYMLQECYYNRAICLLQTGDTEGAREDLRLAIESGEDETIAAGAQDILSQLETQGQ